MAHDTAGSLINIKMSFYQGIRNPIVRSSYIRNGIPYNGKMASFFLLNQAPDGEHTDMTYMHEAC